MTKSVATLAALIIRFTTLWFGVIVGLITLAVVSRRLGALHAADEVPAPALADVEDGDLQSTP
jgi:hypothetical protein